MNKRLAPRRVYIGEHAPSFIRKNCGESLTATPVKTCMRCAAHLWNNLHSPLEEYGNPSQQWHISGKLGFPETVTLNVMLPAAQIHKFQITTPTRVLPSAVTGPNAFDAGSQHCPIPSTHPGKENQKISLCLIVKVGQGR